MAVNLDGVLFSAGKSLALATLADADGYYNRKLACAILLSPQSILSGKGLMADGEFCPWAEQRLPSNYDGRLIKNQWYDGYNHDQGIHRLIAILRKNTQLSHFRETSKATSRIWRKYHFRHLVDIKVYSFDFHMTKPERLFVEAVIAKTSVRPGEIAYIDDNDSYAQFPHRIWQCVVIHGRRNTAGRRAALRQYGVEW